MSRIKRKFILHLSCDGGFDIDTFRTLKAAKSAADEYYNTHLDDMRYLSTRFGTAFVIYSEPETGLDRIIYYMPIVDPDKKPEDDENVDKNSLGYIYFGSRKKEWYRETTSKPVDQFTYRGIEVKVFDDDASQQYYFLYRSPRHPEKIDEESCGGWNPDYERYIHDYLDYIIDNLYLGEYTAPLESSDDDYYGTLHLEYRNPEHTEAVLSLSGYYVTTYNDPKILNADISTIAAQANQDAYVFITSGEYDKAYNLIHETPRKDPHKMSKAQLAENLTTFASELEELDKHAPSDFLPPREAD